MKQLMNNGVLRHIVSIVCALLIALIAEHYFSKSQDYLIPATAVFVMLTTVGNLFYQSIVRFVIVVAIVCVLSLVFPPHSLLYARVMDVCIGAVIGVLTNWLVFPRHADNEFRAAMLPLLKIYNAYFLAIVNLVLDENKLSIDEHKFALESQLQKAPDWVYERGFDVGLRKGHQYFLMKTYQVAEILFAMHHVARCNFDSELVDGIREPLLECSEYVTAFFKALETVFQLERLTEGVDDFEAPLRELDRKFQTLVPDNIELLAMSREDAYFNEFIYNLSDLRKALIKLGQALR